MFVVLVKSAFISRVLITADGSTCGRHTESALLCGWRGMSILMIIVAAFCLLSRVLTVCVYTCMCIYGEACAD